MNNSRMMQLGLIPLILACPASVAFAESAPGMAATQSVLSELHLTPDALAASGVDTNEASSILGATFAAMSDSWDSYNSACTQINDAIVQLSQVKQQLRSAAPDDPGRTQLESDRQTLESQIAALQQTRAGLLDVFQLAATNAMDSEDRARFAIVHANMQRSVPMAYRILSLTEEQWSELRHALAVIKTNEEPPSAFTQLVSGYQSYDYHLAEAHLQTNLGSVSSAYSGFLLNLDP